MVKLNGGTVQIIKRDKIRKMDNFLVFKSLSIERTNQDISPAIDPSDKYPPGTACT
jgi:hypothetical protein